MDKDKTICNSVVVPELYFLISKFLSNGPLKETANVLIKELEEKKVLPKRLDWYGEEHDQSYNELEKKYSHVGANHLLEICSRIGPILDKELIPSVSGIISLLGSGRQSLLRTKDTICKPRSLLDYLTRINGMPLPDSANSKPIHNLAKVLIGRESSATVVRKQLIPTTIYNKTQLLRRTIGHLSAVYCVLFDRTGRYIITGADDLLVKLWSATDGRLLATFRGASAEITDIAINLDNTLLAAGSLDRILRVWDLQSTAPIAVLPGHTGMITSVNFCPSPRTDLKYLVTTSTDGSIAFWQYIIPRNGSKTTFAQKPIQYHEKLRPGQAQMMCTSFSPGGIFLAAGSADHHVRVYIMSDEGPKRILETEAYRDAVDSIQWGHRGLKFISGSKDGTAHVWKFESQQWKSMKLTMSDRLVNCPEPEEGKKLKVTMVAWDCSDKYVITAVNDYTIKIWDSKTGRLHRVLRGHEDEIYVLESNPKDEFILLSAGHDGQLFLWDIDKGTSVINFLNEINGQGHGSVFDAKWSPDGTMIAATDSHGHILMYGLAHGVERFKNLPTELFFHTDYRPLLRDAQHMVMDEQTQMMPHLMPPPFLVDVDGNPHAPAYQKLVPGRENCPTDQLVPNIAVGPEGVEVVDGNNVSHLDQLIEALANRNGQDQPDSNNDRQSLNNSRMLNNSSPRGGNRLGFRRDVEGVRQSSGNWQRDASFKFIRRTYVRPMKSAHLSILKQKVYASGLYESDQYKREMRRRPIMITTGSTALIGAIQSGLSRARARRGRRPVATYQTRAVRDRDRAARIEEEEEAAANQEDDAESSHGSSEDSSYTENESEGESSDSDSTRSDYSDWGANNTGPNLEPPKRLRKRRNSFSSSDVSQPAAGTSSTRNSTGEANGANKKRSDFVLVNGEIPELYRPSEWLAEVVPRKAPYYPQMGDEIVYFRQGHKRYLDVVRQKNIYKLSNNSEPWNSMELRSYEFVQIVGMKYEIKPPRLCCLKLRIMEAYGDRSFTIKYHDIADVLDFLVLRQTYDLAVERNWSPGDRFRCMIDDCWWMGQIESHSPNQVEFPDSLFMSFFVKWDNGEREYMSPWDMEPLDENRVPSEVGGAIRVLPEELRATLYQPKAEEWPRGDRDASCRRILNALERIMGLAIADPFLAPVDLNIYPAYAKAVAYPIDLTTIKSRFENHFYRRITSAQFDVRFLAMNAEKFNKPHTNIVRHARIISDLCLKVISSSNELDVGAVYHQLVDCYVSDTESENEIDNDAGPSTSTAAQPSRTSSRQTRSRNNGSRRSTRNRVEVDWRVSCRQLLEMLWQNDDSQPFREPVDTLDHPDYLQVVETPMDLRTVKEDLLGGNYETALDFAKDVRLIFQNSRNYNTNKRSRIYAMTLRLSILFETQIKQIIYDWKSARRRSSKNSSPRKPSSTERNRPGPSTRAGASSSTAPTVNTNHNSSDDDDDDDDDNGNHAVNGIERNGRSSGRNRVTSTMRNTQPGPSTSRNSRSRDNSRSDSSDSSGGSSSDSIEDSDDSNSKTPTNGNKSLGRKHRGEYDSEDSYKPNDRTRGRTAKKSKKSLKRKAPRGGPSSTGESSSVKRRRRARIESDTEGEEQPQPKKRRGRPSTKHVEQSCDSSATEDDDEEEEEVDIENDGTNTASERTFEQHSETEALPRKRRGRPPKQVIRDLQSSPDNSLDSRNVPNTSRRSIGLALNDNDHTYILPDRNGERIYYEEEEQHQNGSRPTRASARKALLEWARTNQDEDDAENVEEDDDDDDDNEDEDDESAEEIIQEEVHHVSNLRNNRRQRNVESEQNGDRNVVTAGPSNVIPQAIIPRRQVRTNRNTRVVVDENMVVTNVPVDEPESDDEPLALSQRNSVVQRSRSRITRNTDTYHNHTTTRSSTFNYGGVSTSNYDAIPSSSTSQRNPSYNIETDHNYGEPGPSTIRNTRRTLSRHQQNADELDNTSSSEQTHNVSSRLRLRNTVNSTTLLAPSTATVTSATTTIQRRGRSHHFRNVLLNHTENTGNSVSNDDEDSGGSDEGTDGSSKHSSESSDSDDNQPLTSFVPAKTSRRNKRNISREHRDSNHYGSRSTRNQKRPRYNENSDESAVDDGTNSRRRRQISYNDSLISGISRLGNNNEDTNDSDANDQMLSVSSRGRVRKITPKARGIFRD